MHKPYKKITAQLLLFSFLLESCYNPNIGMGKKALPTPDPADKQGQYAGEPHDKYSPKPTSHTLTTADKHPVRFTYQNGEWQAAIKEHAAHGSSQRRELPVVFERGLTLEDVVDSNPTEQKQLLHLCPSQEEPDQPGYVYVGRGPMPQPQLLSSPAARQTGLQSAVGLAQQQATAQPRQGKTSPQQAQEQPGPQAVLALTGPVQEIGEGPRSQDQLPTTPARVISKSLSTPGGEAPRQGVANTQPTSAQQAPSRRALSWRNQHELLHSQRAAQAKRAQSAAMAKPGNQLAQPAAPSQAIVSLTPAHPPSLAHKAPQGIASQVLLAQGGHPVRFMHRDGQWWASVRERIGAFYRVWVLPVACQGHGDIAKALADLQAKPTQYTQRRIHVMHTKQIPSVPQFVYLGAQGLQGGGNGADEPSGSGEPQDEPAAGGQEDAQGREPSQSLAAQGREASLVTLHERMAQEDIKSTAALVKAFNDAQTPEEQPALQQWIRKYIAWFNEQAVGNLTKEEIQEYRSLAHIEATPANRELLASYFRSLCNKIEDKVGDNTLIEALEYTLQNMVECTLQNIDSDESEGNPGPQAQLGKKFLVQLDPGRDVFQGNPQQLILLGDKLLDKLDATSNAFIQATYPTDRITLYALHQTLVLIQLIASEQLDPTQEGGLYSRFQKKIQDISASSTYYPIRYHALLLEQSLQRLASRQARLQGILRRVGHGLKGTIYLGQVARALSELNFNIEDFQQGWQHLQAAFTRQGIQAEDWYDWHQLMHYARLLSLEDASKYKEVFEQGLAVLLAALKAKKINPKEGRQALRFGVVQQLRLLALEGPTPEVREASTKQLSELAKPEEWGGKPAVMEGLLDGLAAIAVQSQGTEQEQAQAALETLESLAKSPTVRRRDNWPSNWSNTQRKKAAQEAIQAWLGEDKEEKKTRKLAEKLSEIKSIPEVAPTAGSLFCRIHSLLREEMPVASQAPADAQAARQKLRAYYQHLDFAQVQSLFEGEAPKHVDSLACELKLIEQVKKKADGEGPQSDLSTHHERLEWVKNPIALEDLFKKRKTKPDGPEQAIQKVLLVGEPGTGKTTLSKKMASLWAQGKWGQEFNAVYVLPVRALQQSQYDNVSMRRDETLPTAIANNCFAIPPTQGKEYERLRDQISEELAQPTTLVVLDGLDERYGASEKLLSQAKAGTHKLLMLSRPYGIEQERTLSDIEIEHAGFNDGQMEAYVRGDLPELGEELLAFIKAYPAITSIAHVPVNLQILCALWKDKGSDVRAETSNGSLPGLYRMLTEYTCNRYEERQRKVNVALPYEKKIPYTDRQELFDKLGQVALKGLEQGEVLISEGLVGKVLGVDAKLKAMLKDSGFLLLEEVEKQYQFPHLTFQEYFAGRWLARQLLSSDGKVREKGEKFFSKHKYEPQYGQMLSFLAGEVSKEEGVDGTRQLLSLLQKGPQEVVGVQHVLLQLRLLNEWLCVAGEEDLEEELAELEAEFPVMASLAEWFSEGVDRVRRGDDNSSDDRRLLNLLTRGLQGSRAVAAHAPALLEPLLAAAKDEDADVRDAARSALAEVAKAAPALAEKVLEPLLAAAKDSDKWVRSAARSALAEVAKAAPALAEKVLEPLLAAAKDSDKWVRSAARSALAEVAKAAPALAEKVLEPLLAAAKDSEYSVRSAARSALAEVAKAAPEKVLEPLLAAAKDEDADVRDAARSALAEVAKAAPEKVLEPLLAAAKDEDADVRDAARSALAEVAKAAPALAEKVLEPLLAAAKDEDADVRYAASRALAEVAKAAPALAEKVLEPLLAAAKDEDWYVRSAASRALAEVAKAAPALAEKVLEPLLAAAKDEDWYVRRAASSALAEVAKAAPALAEKVLEPLLAAAKDSEYSVRSAARSALAEVAQAAPALAEKVLEPLLAAAKDEDADVRYAASSALAEVAQAAPALAEKVLEPLLAAAKDSEYSVRSAARSALAEVAKAAPEKVLEPLLAAAKDEDADVRDAARSALAEVAKAAPEKVLEPLLAASKDEDSWVRSAARSALAEVAKAAPEKVLEPLLAAAKDEDADVRDAARSALAEVAKAAPEKVLEPLLAAAKDEDASVRKAARSALAEVAKAAPALAEKVLEPLLAAAKDEDADVRYAARSALGEFSLQQLINAYWDTQNQALIPFIAPQLYHTPLLVQNIPHSEDQRLVLYPTAGERVVWNKPQQEVQCFVKQIKSATKQWTPLMSAAVRGNLALAKSLVDQGAAVNQATSDGRTPLVIAAEHGHLAVVECLQKAGASLEATDKEGKTPLWIAAKHGHKAVVECLQKAGANIETPDKKGRTPLWIAAKHGHKAVVECLQKAGANIETPDKDGKTPLWIAAEKEHLELAQFLVDQGAAVNQATADGRTPLWIAAQAGHLAVVEYLQAAGASLEATDKEGKTPLWIAAKKGHLALAKSLVEKGAGVNQATADGRTPLMSAAEKGHLEVAQFLVEKGADVHQATTEGKTLLMIAAEKEDLELAKSLVEKGAGVDQAGNDGVTPLWIAAWKGHLAVVEYLQKAGANLEATSKDGVTPLMTAAYNNHLKVAQFLVDQGAAVDQAMNDGRTPLWIAAQAGHLAVVEYLQKAGAKIEATDKEGKTPLWIAAQKGHLAVVACLQKAGASLEATDKEGRTPLMIAAEHGHLAVVACLQKAGASLKATDKEGKTPLMIAKQRYRSEVVQFLERAQGNKSEGL